MRRSHHPGQHPSVVPDAVSTLRQVGACCAHSDASIWTTWLDHFDEEAVAGIVFSTVLAVQLLLARKRTSSASASSSMPCTLPSKAGTTASVRDAGVCRPNSPCAAVPWAGLLVGRQAREQPVRGAFVGQLMGARDVLAVLLHLVRGEQLGAQRCFVALDGGGWHSPGPARIELGSQPGHEPGCQRAVRLRVPGVMGMLNGGRSTMVRGTV